MLVSFVSTVGPLMPLQVYVRTEWNLLLYIPDCSFAAVR